MKMKALRVMDCLKGAEESLLSAVTSKQGIRTAIEQFHLQKSIFRLSNRIPPYLRPIPE